jgi:hypothetical protein
MKILEKYIAIARANDGAGGGGSPPPNTPPASSTATPPAPAAGAGAAPPAGTPPGQAQGDPPAAAAADYWPEGLDQQYKGTDPKATLDNLAKALTGYRQRDAARDVPEKAEGYMEFDGIKGFEMDPAVKPYFDMLPKDPAFKPMAAAALKHGVSRAAVAEIYQEGLKAMAEGGMLEPVLDPAKEKAALVPEGAKSLPADAQDQAVQKRMQENYDFLQLATQNMGLDGESAKYAELMLGDAANGHKFFEWIRSKVQGAGTAPNAGVGSGSQGATREALRAELAALNQGDPDYAKKHAAIQQRYQQTIPD